MELRTLSLITMDSRIFVYSHPRTGSNLLAKLLETHPSLLVKQYPFLDAIRLGPDKQFLRNTTELSEEMKTHPRSNKTLQEGLDDMETWIREAKEEGKMIVMKEHAYQTMFAKIVNAHLDVPREDLPIPKMVDHFLDVAEEKRSTSQAEAEALPSLPIPNPTFIPDRLFVTLRPVFIIRHPAKAIASFSRASTGFGATIFDEDSMMETQYKWLRMVYDCYKALYESQGLNGVVPVVIDGDKLVNDTENQMNKLCSILGIDPSKIRYTWDAVDKFDSKLAEKFIGTIGRSTGVIRQKDYRTPVLEEEAEKWAGEWDERTAEKMKYFAEKTMEDYQYLLEHSI
ncbi:hypothetical protein PM082_020200 [Marasmius tenuissimus]|nr:hypothetical protein PM082_020200 [Marasmius tenuissimus]